MLNREADSIAKLISKAAERTSGVDVVVPLHCEAIVVRRAESAAQAVVETVEAPAEVAPGAVDRLAHDRPKVLQTVGPSPVQYVDRRHAARLGGPSLWPVGGWALSIKVVRSGQVSHSITVVA